MNAKRNAAVAVLALAMAAPTFAQAAPRSKERMHHPARYHSANRYEDRPAYRYEYQPETGDEVGVIADDVTGENPFGAPPYPWGYQPAGRWWR